jgi:hypothetical protein
MFRHYEKQVKLYEAKEDIVTRARELVYKMVKERGCMDGHILENEIYELLAAVHLLDVRKTL